MSAYTNSRGKKVREYKIDAGNSSEGPVGFVCYIEAQSPKAALRKFRLSLGYDGITVKHIPGFELLAYFNPAKISLSQVEEVP